MHEVLVNRLGGLSLPRKSVVRLTDMTLDVYRGRKTTIQPTNHLKQIKVILSTVKNVFFYTSDEYDLQFFTEANYSKQRLFGQLRA